MNRHRATAWFGLTAILIICGAMAARDLLVVTATAQDAPPTDVAPRAAPPAKVAQDRTMSGNPLWAVPLASLTETGERPLFSPSRRPPAPVVAAPRVEPVAIDPPPAPPTRPPLDLVGTITGPSQRIAVFTDTTTSGVVRLRTGDSLDGWVLRSVARREATLQRESETAILALTLTGNAVPPARAARIPPRPVASIPPRLAARLPPRLVARLSARLSARLP